MFKYDGEGGGLCFSDVFQFTILVLSYLLAQVTADYVNS